MWLSQGCSPLRAAPVLLALSPGFWSTACATLPWLVPQKQSTANQHHRQSTYVMCRYPSRRVFLNLLQSPKSCISTWAASRQPHSCGLSWGKHTQALLPLILGEQKSSSKCEFVVLCFPAFLITEGFGKGEVGTLQHELKHPCPDRLLITGAVSSISVKTSKSVTINAKQN